MKKFIITFAAVAVVCAAHCATAYRIFKGENENVLAGQLVGIEATTVAATQGVTLKSITVAQDYTNAYETVNVAHAMWSFTITNYDGNASIATNVLDRFSYADWRANGTNYIISAVTPSVTNIAETLTRVAPGVTRFVTNTLITATASSGYVKSIPETNTWHFGGTLLLDAGVNDTVKVLIK